MNDRESLIPSRDPGGVGLPLSGFVYTPEEHVRVQAVIAAARALWDVLMDGIADGGDVDVAWNEPYLISTTRFGKEHDTLLEALRPFIPVPADGF